jgi:predicted nucleic acid-binding protein
VGLIDDLGRGPIGLDTVVFIYLIEEHPHYFPAIEPIFRAVSDGALDVVTSGITLLESLVQPYRRGDAALAQRYERILTQSRGVHVLDLDRFVLRAAARLRAALRLKTPDALQIAAALLAGCPTYVTNDRALPAIPGLRVVQLHDYATPA